MDSSSFDKSISLNTYNVTFASRPVLSTTDLNNGFRGDTHGQLKGIKKISKNEFGSKGVSPRLSSYWIERVFEKRECVKFIQDGNSDR